MSDTRAGRKIRLLLLNPNSSSHMSDGMMRAIQLLDLPDNIVITPYTAPSDAPDSINDDEGIRDSTSVVLRDLTKPGDSTLASHDGILIACFSVHTLVKQLQKLAGIPVLGIFEASIVTALPMLRPEGKWGIVTTGKFWEDHLAQGVYSFLGQDTAGNSKFAGVFSTGLNAGDFETVPPEEVKARMKDATARLLRSGNIEGVTMGCAGMAGLEDIIRSTAVEVYGEQRARNMYVVDAVKAGVLQLQQMVQSKRLFTG